MPRRSSCSCRDTRHSSAIPSGVCVRAQCRMFLLGRQAMFGHDPPTYWRSITATRWPCLAKVHAAMVDPVPPPRITRSYASESVCFHDWADEVFFVLFMRLVLSE